MVALQRGALRQVADAQSSGAVYAPAGRLLLAQQDAQQRGFSRPVSAYQGDAIAMGHAARNIPKDVLWVE
jgi:hypothetical protein